MINRPLAYKGPVDHLTNFFSENVLMDGLGILLQENLVNWQNLSDEKYIKGTCLCDGHFTKQILYWPLSKPVGSCSCEDEDSSDAAVKTSDAPCEHLAALAIESKTRLHRLPPSIHQQNKLDTGKKYIRNWLKKQKLDPFPAMARHRVIYLLQEENNQWIIECHKSYLTKEQEYQIKNPINLNEAIEAELTGRKNTKFFSLADQQILHFISKQIGCYALRDNDDDNKNKGSFGEQINELLNKKNSSLKNNQFVIEKSVASNRMIKALVQTDRLFWQSSHRSAITLTARNKSFWRDNVAENLKEITRNYYLDLKHNSIIEVFEKAASKSKLLFPELMNKRKFEVQPVLKITSTEVSMPWRKEKVEQFDVAKLSFLVNGNQFSLKSLLPLILEREARREFSETLASYLLQIENLAVLESGYNIPIIEQFHFGDREFDSHLSHMLPILNGLYQLGWKIEIEKSFRLNRIFTNEWYIDLRQGTDVPSKKQGIRKKEVRYANEDSGVEPTQLSLLGEVDSVLVDSSNKAEFDWFELEVGVKIQGKSINLMPYIVSLIQRDELDFSNPEDSDTVQIKLASGETLSLESERVHAIFSSFIELNNEKSLSEEDRLRLPSNQFGRLVPLLDFEKQLKKQSIKKNKTNQADAYGLTWENGKKLARKAKRLSSDSKISMVDVPRELRGELRDYQQSGLNWLQFIRKHQLGGILADDMGLGKTIQTIAHILVEKKAGRLKAPCLVVAPTSLLSNWQQETHKFAPSLNFLKLSGGKRGDLYPKIASMDVVVTSYGLVLRDINKLRRTRFHLLILDEAQVIKNTRSKITAAVNDLRSNGRLCLTGTPMENHLGELWSLFQFLMPSFLGSEYQFNQLYRYPIEKNQDYLRQTLLAKRVAPLMLRRTKNEVATELPSKTEIVTLIELEESQADLYETIRVSMMEQVTKAMTQETQNRNQFLIGNALLKLRQVCCHSSLIKLESARKIKSSAKVSWLRSRLPTMVEQGRRILLFSSFTSMLDILAEELVDLSIPFLMLTGKSKHRGKMVELFQNSDVPVFLISLKAGGVGLNLTAADTVIHYDPWWNPAAEQQANDRAYRIGQDKPVFVYKLITKGTVEEKIQQMQQQKNQLAQGLYNQEGIDTLNLASDDWQALFQPIEGF